MIKEKDIKPIPKHILNLIKKKDNKTYSKYSDDFTRILLNKKEILEITVAVKNKGENWHYKQVAIHGLHSEKCLVKDMECFPVAGYVVG
ncbi:MAG: hypothetical protein PHO06_02880 [Clostridia bacterium]|jgi:hypothetical protein|nr:hypothetical protein [Clostridia bacterium]